MRLFGFGDDPPESGMESPWLLGAIGSFTFLVCYLRSFLLPNVPFLLWGDALGYATKGSRILDGEWPYLDFFDFVTPGTELVYALLFRLVGVALWVPNLLMCVIATVTAVWVTWCARRLMLGNFVLLPGLLITGFVLSGAFDATHHWLSTLFVMAAVTALFDGVSSWRVLAAGSLCGLAASFTQSKGAAALLALLIYLWCRSRQEPTGSRLYRNQCLQLSVAAIATFALINVPFIIAAGMHRWFADLVVFPLRYFGSVPLNNWRGMVLEFGEKRGVLKWVCLPFLYFAVPVSYFLIFAELWKTRENREKRWDQLLLLAIAGAAMLMAVASALSMRRISCASPPAMILLVWILSQKARPWQTAARALGAISLAVACAQVAAVQFRHYDQLDLPTGHFAIPDARNTQVYRYMASRTRPGEWYFGMPPYTLPLGLKNPTPVEAPAPGDYSRPEQITAIVQGLDRTQTEILLLRPAMYISDLSYKEDHLQPFHDYLFSHYHCTVRFATGDEVWERIRLP